jgi:hypothetical protein
MQSYTLQYRQCRSFSSSEIVNGKLSKKHSIASMLHSNSQPSRQRIKMRRQYWRAGGSRRLWKVSYRTTMCGKELPTSLKREGWAGLRGRGRWGSRNSSSSDWDLRCGSVFPADNRAHEIHHSPRVCWVLQPMHGANRHQQGATRVHQEWRGRIISVYLEVETDVLF